MPPVGDENDTAAAALSESSGTPGAPATTEAAPALLDEAKVNEIVDRRAREIAEQIAGQKAKDAEEQAYRRAQSKFDKDLDALRKRNSQRERALLESLPAAGLDPDRVREIVARQTQDEEMETLRERAARADGQEQERLAQEYRDRRVREACTEAGIDPADKRLDLSDPDRFQKSLIKAVREDAAKTAPAKEPAKAEDAAGPAKPKRTPTVDVLGGGSGGRAEETLNYQSPTDCYDAEWKRVQGGRKR